MSRPRQAFVWMAGLSLVTLALGLLREFMIARELQASGAADLFFRGLVVINTARMFGLTLFRARWIPVPATVPARTLMRAEQWTCAVICSICVVVLAIFMGLEISGPTGLALAGGVVVAVYGSAVRALAERAGRERSSFALEWALPIGAIAGALVLPRSTLGPALGLLAGLVVGLVALLPVLADSTGPEGQVGEATSDEDRTRTRVLLLDALVYGNLGMTDTAFSPLYAAGQFALLNYGYLFVNAAVMPLSAAATVVGLRLATGGDPSVYRVLRRWAVIGGIGGMTAVAAVGGLLMWEPVARVVDARVGWSLSAAAGLFVVYSAPFGGLRLMNSIGRQFVVANEPRRVLRWDLIGLIGRAGILGLCALTLGIAASPLALVFAEAVQIAAWWHMPRVNPTTPG